MVSKKRKSKFLKTLDNPDRDMFQFSVQYQVELLKYLIQNKESVFIILKIKSSYFTLLEHSLACEAIVRAFRKFKKIPNQVVLEEFTVNMLNSNEFVSLTTKDDLKIISELFSVIYSQELKDPDIIRSSITEFIAYIEMRDMASSTDFSNLNNIQDFYQRVGKVLRESSNDHTREDPELYMVDGLTNRQLQRKIDPEVIPTPFKQLNRLTNAGGYPTGSVIVLLDKAKAKKTFTLINVARGYLAMKKNVLYIDTENGSSQIMSRMVQSTMKKTKKDLISGNFDDHEKKQMRKYKRLGVEFIVRRVPALIADSNTIRSIIRKVEMENNIKIHLLFLDYAGKLASTMRDKDDFERISNVYIDIQNLALEEGIEAVWTAHHITRDGSKHSDTKYEENDVSGSIAIIRNAQAILGLNQTIEERENNIQRMEVVVQRDGVPTGRALFHLDVEKQHMQEFTKEQRKAYDETQGVIVDDLIINGGDGRRKFKRSTGNEDPSKAAKKGGDI